MKEITVKFAVFTKSIHLNKIHHYWEDSTLSEKPFSYLLSINYFPIATSPESTQTANAAMSTAATGKKNKIEPFINNTTVIKSSNSQ